MKTLRTNLSVKILVISLLSTSTGCKHKESQTQIVLSTKEVIAISSTRAKSGGDISYDGGSEILSKGVCYSTKHFPTTEDSITTDGSGSGSFISYMTNLQANMLYFVRAYAINYSGTYYGEESSIRTLETIYDIDGNSYNTVSVGTKLWFSENLKTTKYNDGSEISLNLYSQSPTGWCWYNNDVTGYKTIYGVLYNGYAVKTGKLCPVGWHVSTWEDWNVMIDSLGGVQMAGDKLKETGSIHWNSANINANNESGFTALPGGYLRQSYYTFEELGSSGNWWAGTEIINCFGKILYSDQCSVHAWCWTDMPIILGHKYNPYLFGFSVRCVKD